MKLVVLIAASLVVISKLCDVLTTIRYVGQEGESNRIAGWLFARIGFLPTLWIIWGIVVLEAAVFVFISYMIDHWVIDILITIILLIAAAAQFSVAHFNATHRHNFITRIISYFYFSPEFWNRIMFWDKNKISDKC